MSLQMILINIVVPMVAAGIGGLITLLGVRLTIKNQDKKEQINRINHIRPWIYLLDNTEGEKIDRYIDFLPEEYDETKDRAEINTVVVNTDNGIAVIDRIESEKCIYKPDNSNVIPKNSRVVITVMLKNHIETLKDFRMYFKDIDKNEYEYHLRLDKDIFYSKEF